MNFSLWYPLGIVGLKLQWVYANTLYITRVYAKCLHRPIVIINQQYTKGEIYFIKNVRVTLSLSQCAVNCTHDRFTTNESRSIFRGIKIYIFYITITLKSLLRVLVWWTHLTFFHLSRPKTDKANTVVTVC